MKKLTKRQREVVEDAVCDYRLDSMFGDGQEREMVMFGVHIKGIVTLTGEELMNEFVQYVGCDDFEHVLGLVRGTMECRTCGEVVT